MLSIVKKDWLLIVSIFAIFVLFGSISIKFNVEKFKNADANNMADLQSKLLDEKKISSDWQNRYDTLDSKYKSLDEKLNDTKKLLQKEQNISNQNAYLEIPNFECKDCDEIKNFETSFEKCKELCDNTDSCDLINYYSPNKICKLVKNMDYNKMKYSSYDMYLKTNKNNMRQFNVNKLKL